MLRNHGCGLHCNSYKLYINKKIFSRAILLLVDPSDNSVDGVAK